MTELNDKLISYGNLSTFYDKLQEQGLGGNAIEDVQTLPDASANKNKFVRLESDKNVYVSECTSEGSEGNPGLGFAAIKDGTIDYIWKRMPSKDNTNEDEGYENYQIAWQQVMDSNGLSFDEVTNWDNLTSSLGFTETENPSIGDVLYDWDSSSEYTVSEYEANVGYKPATPATWDWEKVATEQYVDDAIDNIEFPEYVAGEGIAIDSANTISCTVKPIADVSVLPDAEANKDSVLRLNGDKKVYLSKYNSNNAPDSEQVGVAYISGDESESEYNKMYYSGTEVTIIASNGTFTGYAWLYDGLSLEDLRDANRISTIKASQIENNDALFYIAENDIIYSSGTTFTCSVNLNTTPMSNMDMSDGYYIKPVGYEWQRVVTEDELDSIGDTFQALEARIYALEHPTTVE